MARIKCVLYERQREYEKFMAEQAAKQTAKQEAKQA